MSELWLWPYCTVLIRVTTMWVNSILTTWLFIMLKMTVLSLKPGGTGPQFCPGPLPPPHAHFRCDIQIASSWKAAINAKICTLITKLLHGKYCPQIIYTWVPLGDFRPAGSPSPLNCAPSIFPDGLYCRQSPRPSRRGGPLEFPG